MGNCQRWSHRTSNPIPTGFFFLLSLYPKLLKHIWLTQAKLYKFPTTSTRCFLFKLGLGLFMHTLILISIFKRQGVHHGLPPNHRTVLSNGRNRQLLISLLANTYMTPPSIYGRGETVNKRPLSNSLFATHGLDHCSPQLGRWPSNMDAGFFQGFEFCGRGSLTSRNDSPGMP